MTGATLGLAFLAGLLSTLSPCILPILPIILAAAVADHRLGPVALAAGVSLSFVSFGLLLATVGFTFGIGGETLRMIAAVLLIALGLVLAVPRLQARFAVAAGPIGNWGHERLGRLTANGLGGQFAVGVLLGAAWSPCVGPTLGAASMLAAQGRDLEQAGLTMLIFGIGAATPLILLGLLSRQALMRWRGRLASAGRSAMALFGGALIITGLLIATDLDRTLEAALIELSPGWLSELTTRF